MDYEKELVGALEGIALVRDGDSNDDHIAALEAALSVALDALEAGIAFRRPRLRKLALV